MKIATLCARRVVTSSSPRSTRWPTEVQFRRSSRRQLYAPQRPSHGERWPALRCDGPRRFKHRGFGAPLQGRDATHRPQFTFRFERCVKRHKSGERRGVSSASRHCAPSRAAWTTQGSGAAGKSADPLMCNVRARIIEGGNKVGSCKGPWPTPESSCTRTPFAIEKRPLSALDLPTYYYPSADGHEPRL